MRKLVEGVMKLENVKISIVIPAHGKENYIQKCLQAIQEQQIKNFECIVVLDGKNPNLKSIIESYPFRLIELEKNQGPAVARNTGARNANGEIVLFLDSDMILFPNATKIIQEKFEDKNIHVIQGMYHDSPANPNFTTKFMALKKWIEYKPNGTKTITHIGSEIVAMRKTVFEEFEGFDEKFKKPTVEDYELGHRISKKYTIIMTPELRGKHHFPKLGLVLKNYYIRTKEWALLFFNEKEKKLDKGATNPTAITSTVFLLLAIISLLLGLIFTIGVALNPLDEGWQIIRSNLFVLIGSLFLFLMFLINLSYIRIYTKEYGIVFAIRALLILILLYVTVLLGVMAAVLRYMLKNKKN